MNTEQAIALLKAEGFRVSKPKAKAPAKPLLNAVGKPLSPLYDPNYRMKHKTSTAHLFKPYGHILRQHLSKWVAVPMLALAILAPNQSHAAEYPYRCGRVHCSAEDGIMTKEGKWVVVTVNPDRYRFTYACWRTFDTLAEARAALAASSKRK